MLCKRLLVFILTIVVSAAIVVGSFIYFLQAPLSSQSQQVTYLLAKGTSSKTMLKQMQSQGIITPIQRSLLAWWIQFRGLSKLLKAGEYQFSQDISPQVLIEKMIKGDVVQYIITLTEGITFDEALSLLSEHPAIKHTLDGKPHYEIMALLGEPFLPAEGAFFPDTYYFILGTSDQEILNRARKTMHKRLTEVFAHRNKNCQLTTPYEVLIMASIIEKEAAKDEERPIISGVFQRRLVKNMLLQADPTVIYGIRETLQGCLTTADLKFDTPYNSYLHKGLPPTPIALPGLKAIFAACHPAEGDSLYFVSRGDGTHHFSSTLEAHNQAVAKYRKKDPQE